MQKLQNTQHKIELDIDYSKIPNAEEVEKSVLATILVNNDFIDKIIKDFTVNLFFNSSNRTIAKAILKLYKENKIIDLVTITTELKNNNELIAIGGVSYISNLTSNLVRYDNIEYHIKILQQEYLRRTLIKIGTDAVNKSFDHSEDIFDSYNEIQRNIDGAIKKVVNYEIKKVGEIHNEIMKQSLHVLNSGQKSGVPSGLKMLDNVTNGWQGSDLIILAGRPGMGKTSAVVCMAMNPAIQQNIPVAIFSLEMSSEQLVSRMESTISGINVSKIVKKQLTNDEILRIDSMASNLKKSPIFIDDTPSISLLELKGKSRKLQKEHGVKLIVIDYLQLMKSGVKTQSRELEIAEISRGLKALAKELNIPIIALSQLSRSVEQRGSDKKPMLSDLRESGSIEQDADMVLFCYRPEYYNIDNYEVGNELFETKGLFMLLIAKHRNGELGEIPLRFIHEQTKIVNYYENNTVNENYQLEIKPSILNNKKELTKEEKEFFESSEEEIPF